MSNTENCVTSDANAVSNSEEPAVTCKRICALGFAAAAAVSLMFFGFIETDAFGSSSFTKSEFRGCGYYSYAFELSLRLYAQLLRQSQASTCVKSNRHQLHTVGSTTAYPSRTKQRHLLRHLIMPLQSHLCGRHWRPRRCQAPA